MGNSQKRINELREKLTKLDQRRAELVAEIQQIHNEVAAEQSPDSSEVTAHSQEAKKIGLFRELFAGRSDVFPVRFESRKSGRSGYQPACKNEWRPGICRKPKVKCAKCEAREFIPVTDEVIRQHLSGKDDRGKPFVMRMSLLC